MIVVALCSFVAGLLFGLALCSWAWFRLWGARAARRTFLASFVRGMGFGGAFRGFLVTAVDGSTIEVSPEQLAAAIDGGLPCD